MELSLSEGTTFRHGVTTSTVSVSKSELDEYRGKMLEIHDEPDCGNAPRRQILRDLVLALAKQDTEHVASLLLGDVAWKLVGERTLTGGAEVRKWVATLPAVAEVTFGSILTHGRRASVDGVFRLA